jgi:hypothetical protein
MKASLLIANKGYRQTSPQASLQSRIRLLNFCPNTVLRRANQAIEPHSENRLERNSHISDQLSERLRVQSQSFGVF